MLSLLHTSLDALLYATTVRTISAEAVSCKLCCSSCTSSHPESLVAKLHTMVPCWCVLQMVPCWCVLQTVTSEYKYAAMLFAGVLVWLLGVRTVILQQGKSTLPRLPGEGVSCQAPLAGVLLVSARQLKREQKGGDETRSEGSVVHSIVHIC